MSIFTEPNQGGNPVLSPIVQKAIDLMNKKKAQQPIVAAPEVIQNQIGLIGNELSNDKNKFIPNNNTVNEVKVPEIKKVSDYSNVKSIHDIYNIKPYATDPSHEKYVNNTYINLKRNKVNNEEEIDNYIKRIAPKSPINAKMIIKAATKYNIDPHAIISLIQQDSTFGTKGKAVRTRNAGNVGNMDDGSSKYYNSWEEGINGVAEWLSRYNIKNKSQTKTTTIIPNNPVNQNTSSPSNSGYLPNDIGYADNRIPEKTNNLITNDIQPKSIRQLDVENNLKNELNTPTYAWEMYKNGQNNVQPKANNNFEQAYNEYMQEQNTPNTPNTPTGEFSNVITDNPDQTFKSPEGQSYVPFRNVQVQDTRMPMYPTAPPDNFEKAYSGYMQEQNTPNTPNTPTGEFSNVITDNPDQTFKSPEGQSYVPFRNVQVQDTRMPMYPTTQPQPQQPIVDTKPKAVNPMPTKEQFIAMTPEQRVKIQQELMDAGYNMKPSIKKDGKLDGTWGDNTAAALKWYEDNLKNGKLPTQGQPATQTASSSSTSTEEKTYQTFDDYVKASGLNPVNQIIESIKPVRKEVTEERLKKIAAANAIGDGLRLIGDAAYGDKGSIGANIPKRDNKYTFKAIEDMRALKDKYEKESKDYGMLKLQQLQNLRKEWINKGVNDAKLQNSKEIAQFKAAEKEKNRKNAIAVKSMSDGGNKKVIQVYDYDKHQYYTIGEAQKNEIINRAIKNDIAGIAKQFKLYDDKGLPDETLIRQALYNDPTGKMFDIIAQKYWSADFEPDGNGKIKPKSDPDEKYLRK